MSTFSPKAAAGGVNAIPQESEYPPGVREYVVAASIERHLTSNRLRSIELSRFMDSQDSDSDGGLSDLDRKGRTLSRSEKPKVAFGRNRLRAFKHFVIFHAIPIGVSLFLIYINIKGYLWATHGMAVWISALQFVAKGHEMLMQASIGLVVLAYIQYLLVHEVGVPFGALFAYYSNRVLPYLVSKEFRASVTTPTFRGPLKIGFVCFVVFSVLLASSVGPSSAIAMLPRLVNVTATAVPVSFRIPENELYPQAFWTVNSVLNAGIPGLGTYFKGGPLGR
jgi:hypothetical protein